jgi:hypothetical protein
MRLLILFGLVPLLFGGTAFAATKCPAVDVALWI